MALSKIGTEAVEHISSSANATYLTVDASEQITVSSEGGAVTTSLQQGLAKAWAVTDLTGTLSDSLNVSSADDDGTADFGLNFTNSFGSTAYVANITPNVTALNPRLYLVSPSRATSACEFRGMESTSGTQLEANVTDTMTSIQGDLA